MIRGRIKSKILICSLALGFSALVQSGYRAQTPFGVTAYAASAESVTIKVTEGTDITAALQEAVNTSSDIVIPAGNYKISTLKLNNVSDIKITATGCTITQIAGCNTPMVHVQDSCKASNITIIGGTWDANKSSAPAFRFNGTTSDITMKNVKVLNSGSDGIRFKGTSGIVLDTVTVNSNGAYGIIMNDVKKTVQIKSCKADKNKKNGIAIYDAENVEISSTEVNSNTDDGMKLYRNQSLKFSNVTVSKNAGYGMVMSDTSKNASMDNCKFEENKYTGIMITSSNNVKVSKTTSSKNGKKEDNSCYGIYISDSKVTLNNVTAEKNYWSGVSITGAKSVVTITKGNYNGNGTRPTKNEEDDDVTAAGIGVYKGAVVTAKEVTCDNNHGSGMVVASSKNAAKAKLTIMGCTLTNNGDHGVGGHPYAVVNAKASSGGKRNLIENNATNGIIISENSQSSYIKDSDINNNGNVGLSIITKSKAGYVENCTFAGNKTDGIRITNSSKVTKYISNCTFTKNGRSGIGVYEKSTVKTISSCKIKNSTSSGIRISNAEVDLISKVKSTGNKNAGISIEGSKVNKISSCTFASNKQYGVYGNGGSRIKLIACNINKNTYDGVRATKNKTVIAITNTTVSSNGRIGVVAVDGGTISKLSGCTITANKKHGVAVYEKSTLKGSSKNKIKKNKTRQIYVQEGAITSLKTK